MPSLCSHYMVVLASVLFSFGLALLKQAHFALSPAPPTQAQYALGPGAVGHWVAGWQSALASGSRSLLAKRAKFWEARLGE